MSKRKRFQGRVISLAILFGAGILLVQSARAGEAALAAVKLCATVIIPSLFPYMVISSLIVTFGATRFLEKHLAPLNRLLFRLPGAASSAILLGALCGFPIGAKTACSLYENGRLKKAEAERLIAIANNTGPAFVIEVVGAHFWGSRGFGLFVYAAQILSAILIGFFYARFGKTDTKKAESVSLSPVHAKRDILTELASAVSDSALSILIVCGFVVFFAVGLSMLESILAVARGEIFLPILSAFTEFTAGTSYAAKLSGLPGAFLTGFALGWSGLSVFAQCKVFTAPLKLRLAPTALCKFFQGILTGLLAALYHRFFFTPSTVTSSCIPVTDTPDLLVLGEVVLLILFCLLPILYEKKRHLSHNS